MLIVAYEVSPRGTALLPARELFSPNLFISVLCRWHGKSTHHRRIQRGIVCPAVGRQRRTTANSRVAFPFVVRYWPDRGGRCADGGRANRSPGFHVESQGHCG